MRDSFNRFKKRFGILIAVGGVISLVLYVSIPNVLPGVLGGVARLVAIVGYLVAVVVGAIYMGGGVLKKRRAEVEALAAKAGYTFEPTVSVNDGAEFLKGMNHFFLFSHERGVLGKPADAETDAKATKMMDALGNLDVTNRISGTAGRYAFQAFDYRYSPHQESKMAQRTTAFLVTLAGTDLPSVRLTPRAEAGVAGKLMAELGGSEIELPDYPHFARMYILRGSDKEAVKGLFTHDLVTYLEQLGAQTKDVTIEAAGEKLLMYRFGKLAEHGEFDASLSAIARIADGLSTPVEK